MDNYKLKISIFIILIVILSLIFYYGIFGFSISYLSEEEIKQNRHPKDNLISSFKINNIETIYDSQNKIYYYSIPDNYENSKYTLKLDLDDGYKYKIVNHATNLITVKYNKLYEVIIYNDDYYYETKIQLTNLPLISIITDSDITDNDTNSIFKYINPSNLDEVLTYNSKIHIRGATSKHYDKKAYKINIYDNNYDKEKNINISNFYYGSSFILDALYRDGSKIRNVLATKIWNDMSKRFSNVDVYTEFVEIFINGEYRGVYVFSEPVNRRNLNLNKSSLNNTSVVLKSSIWEFPDFSNCSNIIEDTYYGYELKYPNKEEFFNSSWNSILCKLSNYYTDFFNTSYDDINNIFNIDNYIDILLFNSFINNSDNGLIKNNYFYQKNLNEIIYIQPWDMEFSFGLSYSPVDNNNVKKTLEDYNEIVFDIKHSDERINKLLVKRYWELRKNVLTMEYLTKTLESYRSTLSKGSASRDENLWVKYDVENDIEEVRTWINNRLEFYDNYIKGLENE